MSYVVTGVNMWWLFVLFFIFSAGKRFLWVMWSTLRSKGVWSALHFSWQGWILLSVLCLWWWGMEGSNNAFTGNYCCFMFSGHWDSLPMMSISISSTIPPGLQSCAGKHTMVPMESEGLSWQALYVACRWRLWFVITHAVTTAPL